MNMVKFKNEFKPLLRSKYPKSRRECLEDKSGTGGQAIVEMPVFKKGQKEQIVLSGNKQTREMSEEERARHEAAIAEGRARRERAKQAQQEQIRGGNKYAFLFRPWLLSAR